MSVSEIGFGDLVTSAGPRDKNLHANTADARAYADALRKKWAKSVSRGEQSFDELMTKAVDSSDDGRYLRKIRLYDLLKDRKGWTEDRAYIALKSIGVTHLTNVQDVIVAPGLFTKFISLFEAEGSEWDPTSLRVKRPEMPEGWPWFERITSIYDEIRKQEENETDEIEEELERSVETPATPEPESHRPLPPPSPYPSRLDVSRTSGRREYLEEETRNASSVLNEGEENEGGADDIDLDLLSMFLDDAEDEELDEFHSSHEPISTNRFGGNKEVDGLLGL